MDTIFREALRRERELRHQLDNLLLGDERDMWEAELRKFVAKRPCWPAEVKSCLKRLFENKVITFSGATVHVHQLVTSAPFAKIYGDLGEKLRCWKDTEEALAFSKQNKDKLGPNGNFFELEGGSVADVFLDSVGEPYVYYVYPFTYDYTWRARYPHRVFSLQQ